jgi:CheY-like chemotaxis protein
MSGLRPSFLLVEDTLLDQFAVERGLREVAPDATLHVTRTASDALMRLRAVDPPLRVPGRPLVILLDLSLPGMDGHGFLDELRTDPLLYDLPVFVLTTSSARRDVERAYARQVAGYIVKGDFSSSFRRAARLLADYVAIVELP